MFPSNYTHGFGPAIQTLTGFPTIHYTAPPEQHCFQAITPIASGCRSCFRCLHRFQSLGPVVSNRCQHHPGLHHHKTDARGAKGGAPSACHESSQTSLCMLAIAVNVSSDCINAIGKSVGDGEEITQQHSAKGACLSCCDMPRPVGGEGDQGKRSPVPKRFHGIIVASNAADGMKERQ